MSGPEVVHQNLEASGHETILDDRLDPLPIPHRLAHSRYGSSGPLSCSPVDRQLRQAFVETLVADGHGVDWGLRIHAGRPCWQRPGPRQHGPTEPFLSELFAAPGPLPVGRFRLSPPTVDRHDETFTPIAEVVADMGNDTRAWTFDFRRVPEDIRDCHTTILMGAR